MPKWIALAVTAVLTGVAGCSAADDSTPADREAAHAELTGIQQKLAKTGGGARVDFTASLDGGSPAGAWEGVSKVRFAEPSWDTTYTKMTSVGDDSPQVSARRLHLVNADYYTSKALKPADGRPWYQASETTLLWGSPLSDPQLNVADIATWLPVFARADEKTAAQARIGDHEYRLTCKEGSTTCPASLGSTLDAHFNVVSSMTLHAVLNADGLLQKLEVEAYLAYREPPGGAPAGDVAFHPSVSYRAAASFTVSQFGTVPQITAPAAGDISRSDRVDVKPG
jgi:hypothetical protein